jgi:hypothetical protein
MVMSLLETGLHPIIALAVFLCTRDPTQLPILREEVEEAVKALKKGKAAGIDKITGELVQAEGRP